MILQDINFKDILYYGGRDYRDDLVYYFMG